MRTLTLVLLACIGLAGTARAEVLAECFDAVRSEDDKRAAVVCRQAAEQGHAEAQYNLGWMYDGGLGVTQDQAEAVKWYRKAAEQGHAKAHNNLAVMYAQGRGVTQDYVKAHALANIAAAQGVGKADELRDLLASEMTAADISKAQQLARECAEKDYKNCGF